MSVITIEQLKEQLAASEQEFEAAKSHVYRTEGVIQLLKHQLALAEKPVDKPEPSKKKG